LEDIQGKQVGSKVITFATEEEDNCDEEGAQGNGSNINKIELQFEIYNIVIFDQKLYPKYDILCIDLYYIPS